MSLRNKMLRAAIPQVELPRWFEVRSRRDGNQIKLSLTATVSGNDHTIEQVVPSDSASVMDVLNLWPNVSAKVPTVAQRALGFLPVPANCTIKGAPVPDESTPQKEKARLTLDAVVMGKTLSWSWDSQLDKLYMADLVETLDWLRALQAKKGESENVG